MPDDQPDSNGRLCSDRGVELRVAARLENLAVVRLLVGAVSTFEDLDVDTVADLRLAVDELCTQLIRCATPESTLVVIVDPDDEKVAVHASTTCRDSGLLAPESFSWHVLTSLADEAQPFRDGSRNRELGGVFGVTLITRRASAVR